MRRYFYDEDVSTKSPLTTEVLMRIRELYAIEDKIRGHPAGHHLAVRQARSRPIVEALHEWLQDKVKRVSGASDLAKAMRYAIQHWPGLVVFLDDGRVEMDTNVLERAIRPNTLTRKNALFAGSDGGGRHWAEVAKVPSASADGKLPEGLAMTLIQTAKPNDVDPMAWLTDVLERLVSGETKAHELHTLLPWTWAASNTRRSPLSVSQETANCRHFGQVSPSRMGRADLQGTTGPIVTRDNTPSRALWGAMSAKGRRKSGRPRAARADFAGVSATACLAAAGSPATSGVYAEDMANFNAWQHDSESRSVPARVAIAGERAGNRFVSGARENA